MTHQADVPFPPARPVPGEALRSAAAMRRARRAATEGERTRVLHAIAETRSGDADWLFFIGRHFGPNAQRRPGRPDPTLARHA